MSSAAHPALCLLAISAPGVAATWASGAAGQFGRNHRKLIFGGLVPCVFQGAEIELAGLAEAGIGSCYNLVPLDYFTNWLQAFRAIMKSSSLRVSPIALLFTGLCAGQSNVIFNNIVGPCAPSPTQCFYVNVDGANAFQPPASVAAQFTPASAGSVVDARLFVGAFFGGSPLFNVALFSDAGGLPGAPLGPAVMNVTAGNSGGIVTASFSQPVTLQPNVPYWLVLTPGSPTTDVGLLTGGTVLVTTAYTPSPTGSGWKNGGQLAVQFAIDGAAQPSSLAVVSAASYQPTVAPSSLAAIFGSQLAPSVAIAHLDASGNLPTSLGGISVEVGGQSAPLLYVSPSQINCVIPQGVQTGTADVAVLSTGGTLLASGTANLAVVAPAIFTSDSSGGGPGAIINAVTYTPGPFSVYTPRSSGSSGSTFLAIFGTGIRNAPAASPPIPVQATLIDTTGKPWTLPIQYDGPAPGFFGLDQVNVQLPVGLDGAGVVTLFLEAGSTQSNVVSLTIRSSAGPQITSVAPESAPPGGQITITGAGFVPDSPPGTTPRTSISLTLSDGTQIPVPAFSVTATQIEALVPPVPIGSSQGAWYSGAASVCVQVDGQLSCPAGGTLAIAPRLQSTLAPGQVLLTSSQQLLQSAVAALQTQGDTTLAGSIQTEGQSDLNALQTLITAANAGTPATFTTTNTDGSVTTVSFDVQTLEDLDSLLLAGQGLPSGQASAAGTSPHASPSNCAQGPEMSLENTATAYRSILSSEENAGKAYLAAFAAGAAVCILQPEFCTEFYEYVDKLAVGYADAEWAFLLSEIGIDYTNSFLNSLAVDSTTTGKNATTLTVGGTDAFQALGLFEPEFTDGSVKGVNQALSELMSKKIANRLPFCSGGPFQSTCEQVAGKIADTIIQIAEHGLNLTVNPEPAPGPSVPVSLSASSVLATPDGTPGVAALQFACGLPNQLTGDAVGSTGFSFAAYNGVLLFYSNETPSAQFTVTVQGGVSLTLSTNTVASGGTVTGTVTLSAAAPPGGATVSLASSSTAATLPAAISIPAGSTAASFTILAGTVASSQTVTISATYGGASAEANLTVTPGNGMCANLAGNWNASETGSITLTASDTTEGTGSQTVPVSGSGVVTIMQTGCSIQYEPLLDGLIGTSLTPDQLASVLRTGSVSGNNVSVTGLFALVDTVVAEENGVTSINVSNNLMTASGQLSGGTITLNATGNFDATGTYSFQGTSGSFTLTATGSTISTFDQASMGAAARPKKSKRDVAFGGSVHISIEPARATVSATEERNTLTLLRAAFMKALSFYGQ